MGNVTALPPVDGLTRADLDAMPDDGRRYELIDGVIVVSAAPGPRHQTAVLRLAILLDSACPRDLQVFVAPLDVDLAPNSVVEPDVLVAARSQLTTKDLAGPPQLAVEVLSPSTRSVDLLLKKARYERAGCPSYWVLDPGSDQAEVTLTAWELVDGAYVEAARATGAHAWRATRPFEVTIFPGELVR